MLGILGTIAARGDLKASRMPALFLQVQRNMEFWEKEPNVSLGERVSFGKDPLLLQHYRGYGLQIQPLGNFGKANGLWTECEERPRDCKRRTLRALLTSMLRVASTRGRFEGMGVLVPVRRRLPAVGERDGAGHRHAGACTRGGLLRRAALHGGRRARPRAVRQGPPIGVRVSSGRGYHYLLYSFAPGLRVLNAFLQTVTGLHDYAKLNDDRRAGQAVPRG